MTDNVRVQQRLLEEVLGIERVHLAYGSSMGAQQAFHWGALFPDRVERIALICGSAKTSPHNFVFLEASEGGADRRTRHGRMAGSRPSRRAASRRSVGSTPVGG